MLHTIKQHTAADMSTSIASGAANATSSYVPRTLDEWLNISRMIANSSLCPKDFINKPESVFVAIQMGADLGLKPMQSIQNISIINGRPCLWGDAALAVARGHADFMDIEEIVNDKVATCTIKRRNCKDVVRTFSVQDAQTASLWGKQGPWKSYPLRMLQMRARGFALRDAFPDALRGINIAEEVSDYEIKEKNITPAQNVINEKDIDYDYQNLNEALNSATNFDDLQALLPDLQSYSGAEVQKNKLRQLYKEKMIAIKEEDEQESILGKAMEGAAHVDDTL